MMLIADITLPPLFFTPSPPLIYFLAFFRFSLSLPMPLLSRHISLFSDFSFDADGFAFIFISSFSPIFSLRHVFSI
jgi:hypothetical protein